MRDLNIKITPKTEANTTKHKNKQMKKFIIIYLLIFITSFALKGQTRLSLSRVDSAKIENNNTNYQTAYNNNDYREAAKNLDNNAMIYWKHNYFNEAIDYFQKSLELNKRIGNENGIAGINSNLALIYADKRDYKLAYEYFEKTLAARKLNPNNKVGIISVLINESVVLNKLSDYNKAIEKLQEALTLANDLNDENQMKSIYGMLSETYQRAGNTEKAIYYYQYFKTFNEYVNKKIVEETDEKIREQKLQQQVLELENKNKELLLKNQNLIIAQQEETIGEITNEQQKLLDSLSKKQLAIALIEKENELKKSENKRLIESKRKQRLILLIISVAFVIVLITLIWLYKTLREKNKLNKKLQLQYAQINSQNEEIQTQKEELEATNKLLAKINTVLESKNKQITSSINYAKRIQKAILVGSEYLFNLFDDSFLLFQPKDIVAGDFYYFKKINNNEKIIIVGDCTGHGVPGGFLTVLGVNVLNTAIVDKNITKPAEILKYLDNQFYLMLNQEKTEVSDGMDVSICLINDKNSKIEFSGARNPLVLVTKNNLEYIKSTQTSIGYSVIFDNKEKDFKTNYIDITEPTWCYMFSDGIIDQFNDEKKRFTRKKLLDILKENPQKSGKEQRRVMIEEIDNWKGNYNQIDDIILLGIKLKP